MMNGIYYRIKDKEITNVGDLVVAYHSSPKHNPSWSPTWLRNPKITADKKEFVEQAREYYNFMRMPHSELSKHYAEYCALLHDRFQDEVREKTEMVPELREYHRQVSQWQPTNDWDQGLREFILTELDEEIAYRQGRLQRSIEPPSFPSLQEYRTMRVDRAKKKMDRIRENYISNKDWWTKRSKAIRQTEVSLLSSLK